MLSEIGAVLLMILLTLEAGLTGGGSLVTAFAKGHSMEMEAMIRQSAGTSEKAIKLSKRKLLGINLFCTLCILFELIVYLKIYWTLRKNDEKMRKNISKEVYDNRRRKNVITLAGQAWSFGVEFLIGLLTNVLLAFKQSAYIDESIFVLLIIVGSTILSVLHVVSSPELRRYVTSTQWKIL